MLLENFYGSSLLWIEAQLSGKNWLWKLTFFAVALSLFIAFPPYSLLINHLTNNGVSLDAWVFIQNQAQDLLHPKDMDFDVRRENMIFRWTLPLLSFLTGHNVLIILIIQAVLGVLFLYKIAGYVYLISGDKVTTAFFVTAIANIFVSVWAFADVHGYGDEFAFFFLLLALLSKNPLVIFLSLQVAFFTDERAVVAGGYLLLWWMGTKAFQKNDFSLWSILRWAFTGESLVVWVAWAIYFTIREYVQITYFPHHSYSTIGTPVLFANAHRNGLGSSIWGAFEGTWLILIAAFLILCFSKRYWLLLALIAGFVTLVATGIYVHDIDRALSYGFPFILLAVFILIHTTSTSAVRLILFFVMIVCVTHPQVFYMGYNKILWLEPLPVKLFMLLDHRLHWGLFS
ncbi:hypothetical protein LZD49_13370 [Dyadobacter sp. CY261]|uniref:hypothetical protein n=1 Tax=Dyadobacter sp. CY261 TaxID=2907203 RepID=UPI001F471F8B|nr:hypothetical protein [Dyadobacter sp. CY261]MCF0071466.1 hypothetical protein [Dyadobacter sp. CY261]